MYSIDSKGHLDLSQCFMDRNYDMLKVRDVSHEYYFTELIDLVAWDGTPVYGMNSEAKWRHLICKHGHDNAPLNPLTDIELDRVLRLPVLKRVLIGLYDADVYQQINRKGNLDKIEVVVSGEERDYLVSLGVFRDHYVLRSAYHAGARYIHRSVMARGTLVERIRPSREMPRISGCEAKPGPKL